MTKTFTRIGSSVIERPDGTFAFILHFVPEHISEWTPELLLEHSATKEFCGHFRTDEEAKIAGSKALSLVKQKAIARGEVAFRPGKA